MIRLLPMFSRNTASTLVFLLSSVVLLASA
jgi:hypothetical protein